MAQHMTVEFREKVRLCVLRALYKAKVSDENVAGEQPVVRPRKPDIMDDLTQNVIVEFLRHPDWLTKGDGYIWRCVNLALGDYFARERPKRGKGTRGDRISFVDLLRAPADDDDDNTGEPSYVPAYGSAPDTDDFEHGYGYGYGYGSD